MDNDNNNIADDNDNNDNNDNSNDQTEEQEDKHWTLLPSISIRQPEFTKFMASDWSISFWEAQGNATSHLSLQGFASS